MNSNAKLPTTCWICGKAVSLEACVVDEHGMAVHEDCTVAKIASRAKPPARQTKFPLPLQRRGPSAN